MRRGRTQEEDGSRGEYIDRRDSLLCRQFDAAYRRWEENRPEMRWSVELRKRNQQRGNSTRAAKNAAKRTKEQNGN